MTEREIERLKTRYNECTELLHRIEDLEYLKGVFDNQQCTVVLRFYNRDVIVDENTCTDYPHLKLPTYKFIEELKAATGNALTRAKKDLSDL